MILSVTWFATRVERMVSLEEMPLAPLINGMLRKTAVDRKKAAESRRKYYNDISWMSRRAGIKGAFLDGSSLAVLIHVTPKKGSREDVDGRAKAALDSFTKAQVWKDDCQVESLFIERLPSSASSGRIDMYVGVIPAWPAYEVSKQAWIRDNPAATQAEYEAAMRSIAEKAGV